MKREQRALIAASFGVGLSFFIGAMFNACTTPTKVVRTPLPALTRAAQTPRIHHVFKRATTQPAFLVFVASDGQELAKADYDVYPPEEKAAVLRYLRDNGGRLERRQCAQINSKDGSWNAGYCTFETVKTYGKKGGPES